MFCDRSLSSVKPASLRLLTVPGDLGVLTEIQHTGWNVNMHTTRLCGHITEVRAWGYY